MMSLVMPPVDVDVLARRDEIVTALRLVAPGAQLIDDPAALIVYESDGLTAYRQAFHRPKATAGPRDELLGGAALWVLPNPSGLNAHETVDSLATAYAAAARAAGLDLP